jgi:hypothetical protein
MATLLCLTATAASAQTSNDTSGRASGPASDQTAAAHASPDDTPGTMSAERGWSSVARCAQEDSERARHTCVDRVLREAGLLTNEMHAREQRRAFGLDETRARATTAQAPRASTSAPENKTASAARTGETAAAPATPSAKEDAASTSAPPERVEVELASVGKAVNGRLFVTTTDGAVWLQTESVEMPQPPVAGDRMTIRKGSMGGYRCSVVSTHLTYRCARSR